MCRKHNYSTMELGTQLLWLFSWKFLYGTSGPNLRPLLWKWSKRLVLHFRCALFSHERTILTRQNKGLVRQFRTGYDYYVLFSWLFLHVNRSSFAAFFFCETKKLMKQTTGMNECNFRTQHEIYTLFANGKTEEKKMTEKIERAFSLYHYYYYECLNISAVLPGFWNGKWQMIWQRAFVSKELNS